MGITSTAAAGPPRLTSRRAAALSLAAALLCCGPAVLAHDSPDVIAFYFDWDYTLHCRDAVAGDWVGGWLVVDNASGPDIASWECRLEVIGADHVQTFLSYDATDVGEGDDNFIVSFTVPHPVTRPNVHLLLVNVLVGGLPVEYHARPSEPSATGAPSYRIHAGDRFDLHLLTGGYDVPIAVIDGPCPTGDEEVTWGAVKVLYR